MMDRDERREARMQVDKRLYLHNSTDRTQGCGGDRAPHIDKGKTRSLHHSLCHGQQIKSMTTQDEGPEKQEQAVKETVVLRLGERCKRQTSEDVSDTIGRNSFWEETTSSG